MNNMPGVRGLKRCLCDANRVFGWSARPKPLVDDLGDPIYTSFLYDASAVIMPAVNAPYVVERGGVPMGGTPKPDGSFSVGLPIVDVLSGFDVGAIESALSEVHGARVVYDDDGTPRVVYVLGKKQDVGSGVLDWGDGLMSKPCAFVCINLRTGEADTYYLPPKARFGLPQDAGVDWEGLIPYGLDAIAGGGYVWHPACVGFSRDGVVIAENYRVADGIGNVMRFRFSDGAWSVGFGESATTTDGAYICMPAQMSGDGGAWVVAKEYNTKKLFTGRWTNLLGFHNHNEPDPFAGPIAALPAVLTPAEQLNRHDNKTGWSPAWLDWTAIAYTRRGGYDYLIIRPQDEFGYQDNVYFDGRRKVWLPAKGYNNIYAFENGDVVLASPLGVKYVNANGTQRWLWVAPQYSEGDPGGGANEQPFLSGNNECVQVKNVSLIKITSTDPTLIDAASTAHLDARDWSPHADGYVECAITLSREGNPPTCVIHRSLDRVTGNYQMNFYATNETLDAKYDGATPQSHRAFYGRQIGGMSFDCVPSCECKCAISGQLAY